MSTNSGEQYFTFTCLAAWLIYDKCKLNPKVPIEPEEFANPNAVLNGFVFDLLKLNVINLKLIAFQHNYKNNRIVEVFKQIGQQVTFDVNS